MQPTNFLNSNSPELDIASETSVNAGQSCTPRPIDNRKTQCEAILALLQDAKGGWVPLPSIMEQAAQYNTRILELRRSGHRIENKTEHVNGARHSWFRLLHHQAQGVVRNQPSSSAPIGAHEDELQPTFASSALASSFLAFEMGRTRGGR